MRQAHLHREGEPVLFMENQENAAENKILCQYFLEVY